MTAPEPDVGAPRRVLTVTLPFVPAAKKNRVVLVRNRRTGRMLSQAERWLPYANLVSVATEARFHREQAFIDRVCSWLGVGRYVIDDVATCVVRPAFRRARADALARCLRPEHQTWAAAGNATSERWTPFRATCLAVQQAVASAGPEGLTAREVATVAQHHYGTAAAAILRWARAGKIPGVTVTRDGPASRYRIVPATP